MAGRPRQSVLLCPEVLQVLGGWLLLAARSSAVAAHGGRPSWDGECLLQVDLQSARDAAAPPPPAANASRGHAEGPGDWPPAGKALGTHWQRPGVLELLRGGGLLSPAAPGSGAALPPSSHPRNRTYRWGRPLSEKHEDQGTNFFKAAPPSDWAILAAVCVGLLLLDFLVIRRAPQTFAWHGVVIGIWVALAGAYDLVIWSRMGSEKAIEWCSGYLLEWILSMDNLFVFHLIFQTYKTPTAQMHKAVFVGIIGAVFMRLIFFMVVSTLLHAFGWFRWPFGLLLVWSGVEAVRGEDDDTDVSDTRFVRGLKWLLGPRLLDHYSHDHRLFTWNEQGGLQVTMLLVVIVLVEVSDVIFALDSVSAKVAQIPDPFVAFSSSVLAMYGLRAMFFVVEDLVHMFDLLKYGLGLILVFIGAELMFSQWIHLPTGLVCLLILVVFFSCILASALRRSLGWAGGEGEEEEEEPAGGEKLAAEKGQGPKESQEGEESQPRARAMSAGAVFSGPRGKVRRRVFSGLQFRRRSESVL